MLRLKLMLWHTHYLHFRTIRNSGPGISSDILDHTYYFEISYECIVAMSANNSVYIHQFMSIIILDLAFTGSRN